MSYGGSWEVYAECVKNLEKVKEQGDSNFMTVIFNN